MKSDLLNITYEIEIKPGEKFELPQAITDNINAGRWIITIQLAESPMPVRDHSAFLNSYSPEDEGLYDDDAAR